MNQNIELSQFDETIDENDVINWTKGKVISDRKQFVSRLLAINQNSLGIKYSETPFNVNKKITERYIKELMNLKVEEIDCLLAEGLKHMTPKILHLFVQSAQDLKDNKYANECNPYFKIYFKSFCKNDVLIPICEPFVSSTQTKTTNPKWNTKLDIRVPDSNRTDEPFQIIYRQELCVEIWSKKRKISNFRKLLNRLLCLQSNEYLGSVYLRIGRRSSNENFFIYYIPSIALNLKSTLSNDMIGQIAMKIVWGRLALVGQHNTYIKYHILLYILCFEWHLRGLSDSLTNKEEFDSLSYMSFFYSPAISLINQHKIQSNLTTFEDSFIRRSVLMNLIIKYSKESKTFSLILVKILANEEIKLKAYKAWLSPNYIESLNRIEKTFVEDLKQCYLNKISLLTEEDLNTSKSIRELENILKIFRKYHRKYRDLELKNTINQQIKTQVINWININVSNSEFWPQIITFLAKLSELLKQYWYRLERIVDLKDINKILNELKRNVKELIENWRTNRDRGLSENILNYVFFITEFNEFFPIKKNIKKSNETEVSEPLTAVNAVNTDNNSRHLVKTIVNKLKFSEFLKPDTNEINEFWVNFDEEIANIWIDNRVEDCDKLVNSLVQNYINNIKEKSDELKGQIATKLFFNAVSQLIFFPLALKHCWNYNKFRTVLQKLCDLCYRLCDRLQHYFTDNLIQDNECENQQNQELLLSLFCCNTCYVMQKIHLKTDLLELITDKKATLIRKILAQVVDKQSVKDNNDFEGEAQVFHCCQYAIKIGEEIESLEKAMAVDLGNKIVKHIYKDINQLINSSSSSFDQKYTIIQDIVNRKFDLIFKYLQSKQSIADILLIVKTKVEQIFSNQLEYLFDLFKENIGTNDKIKASKLPIFTKCTNKLAQEYKNFYKTMKKFEKCLDIEENREFETDSVLTRFVEMTKKL